MRKKILIIILALLIVINLSAFITFTYNRYCFAHKSCAAKGADRAEMFLCRELALSDAQIEEMHSLNQEFHQQADSISLALFEKRSDLLKMLSVSTVDMNKIEKQQDEINKLQAELQKRVIVHLLKRKQKLTPEQRQKLFSILMDRLNSHANCRKEINTNYIESSCDTNCKQ